MPLASGLARAAPGPYPVRTTCQTPHRLLRCAAESWGFGYSIAVKQERSRMEQILPLLHRWKPLSELLLTLAVIAVAVFAAYIAWRSDATFREEKELLSEAKTLVEQQVQISSKLMDLENQAEALQAEEDFNKALDSADSNCSGCPTCSPNLSDRGSIRESGQSREIGRTPARGRRVQSTCDVRFIGMGRIQDRGIYRESSSPQCFSVGSLLLIFGSGTCLFLPSRKRCRTQ